MATNVRRQENRILSNREIRAREVRLIGSDGANLGILPFFKALDSAANQGLDLILINPMSNPPICKIGDVGKYKYDLQKKEKEQSKKAREARVDIKEVQLRPAIDAHDLNVKMKHIKEWLIDGDKVRIVIKFRGREMANTGSGFEILNNILAEIPEAKVEGKSELQGNRITATLYQGKSNDKKTV
jgi:translation initiation factor IF-3